MKMRKRSFRRRAKQKIPKQKKINRIALLNVVRVDAKAHGVPKLLTRKKLPKAEESSRPRKREVENKYPNVPSWEEAISYLLNPKLVGGKADKEEEGKSESSEGEARKRSPRRPSKRRGGNRRQAPKKPS